jgi:2-haloacid dehalogenase
MTRWATFDCYGTLIDWNGGIRSTLAELWPDADADRLLARYHEIEPMVQRESPTIPYREAMQRALAGTAESEGLRLREEDGDALGRALPDWAPFPEVPSSLEELRRRGWRLAVLSNTDPDLIAASRERLGVRFDEVVTAREAGSYKPAHGHWRCFAERTGAAPAEHVHVAASLFHDIEPAGELGLDSVWINRLGEETPVPGPKRELPDLGRLPETLDELRP